MSGVYRPCHFEPEETVTFWDDDDVCWERGDLWSEGWSCSNCKNTMLGGEIGWFDTDSGRPSFEFCPYCGHPVDKELTMRKACEVRRYE